MHKFFIFGCPRSGTTLVQQILNRHPDVLIPPETKYFCYIHGMSFAWQLKHWSRLTEDLKIELEEPTRKLRSVEQHRQMFDKIANAYLSHRGKTGCRYFGEKTPEHTTRASIIRKVYPEAKFIFVQRDPRAVVASLLDVPWIDCGVRSASFIWNRYNIAWPRIKSVSGDAAIKLQYETLLTNPERSVRQLCQFLEIDFKTEMLCPGRSTDIVLDREREWKSRARLELDTTRMSWFRERLDEFEIAAVERICAKQMQKYGYGCDSIQGNMMLATDILPLIRDSLRSVRSLSKQAIVSELKGLFD